MENNKKHCPAIIGIYYFVDGIESATRIASVTGLSTSTVWDVLNRKFDVTGSRRETRDSEIDDIEREYLNGASTYELADKYGVCHSTISKWMKKRGHVRGKGQYPGYSKEVAKRREIARLNFEQWLAENYGGEFICVDYQSHNTPYTLRCGKCGNEFTRWDDKKHDIKCPYCKEAELHEQRKLREIKKLSKQRKREAEFAKEKHCDVCGSCFHSECSNQKFCSNACRIKDKIRKKLERDREKTALKQALELRKPKTCVHCGAVFHSIYETKKCCDKCASLSRHCDHKERANRYGVEYDKSVTLNNLIQRDENVCQICGELCDKSDRRYGSYGPLYPSIDHITAMANGGGHVWSNVQLAHVICNSIKRDLSDEDFSEEVITHAKEQAAAYKRA